MKPALLATKKLFADDLVIITDKKKLRDLIDLCKNVCDSYDLKANVKKCDVMQMQSELNEPISEEFFWNNEIIEIVSEFTRSVLLFNQI